MSVQLQINPLKGFLIRWQLFNLNVTIGIFILLNWRGRWASKHIRVARRSDGNGNQKRHPAEIVQVSTVVFEYLDLEQNKDKNI